MLVPLARAFGVLLAALMKPPPRSSSRFQAAVTVRFGRSTRVEADDQPSKSRRSCDTPAFD
jgi:hypothetical protein